tara:strand:- start:3671 stop:4813 length:1143 start_codon:yes stop_codon:yes gene_type:complete
MSNLTSYVQTYQGSAPIGGIVNAYVSTTTGPTTTNSGTWVKSNAVYLQADYPELYSVIGLMGVAYFNKSPGARPSNSPVTLMYGNGLYILFGLAANLYTSTDGITWTARTNAINSTTTCIYANGQYVAGAPGTTNMATSTNAITWTVRTPTTTSQITALAYGNSLYIYGGVSGVLGTSTDAITWTARTSGTSSQIASLIYANGLYVYGTVGGGLATSTDAITWTARTSGTSSNITNLAYGAGVYVYGGTNSALATSTDAITWTGRSLGLTTTIYSMLYDGSNFVCGLTSNSAFATSTNAITWQIKPANPSQGATSAPWIVYDGVGRYVMIDGFGYPNYSTNVVTPTTSLYNTATEFLVPQLSYFTSVSDSAIQNVYIRAK